MLANLEWLFVKSGAWTSRGSYAAAMLRTLEEGITLFVRGRPLQVGGPGQVSEEVKARVMGRMVNWLKIAKVVVQAEYPQFELFRSFAAFSLADRRLRLDISASCLQIGALLHVDGVRVY
jgi:hypothetical protein